MTPRGLTRHLLVTIAHEFVGEHGLDALTMRRLAAAAQVTPGALYKHVRDQRDLRRALADSVLATINLSDIDTTIVGTSQVIACFERMRHAMLAFRDGGRIIAGSYAPFAATAALGATVRQLLAEIVRPEIDPGDIAYTLRNYTVGFVLEEQAYLALVATGEWDELIRHPPLEQTNPTRGSDTIAILTGNRDQRFHAGIGAILAGTTL